MDLQRLALEKQRLEAERMEEITRREELERRNQAMQQESEMRASQEQQMQERLRQVETARLEAQQAIQNREADLQLMARLNALMDDSGGKNSSRSRSRSNGRSRSRSRQANSSPRASRSRNREKHGGDLCLSIQQTSSNSQTPGRSEALLPYVQHEHQKRCATQGCPYLVTWHESHCCQACKRSCGQDHGKKCAHQHSEQSPREPQNPLPLQALASSIEHHDAHSVFWIQPGGKPILCIWLKQRGDLSEKAHCHMEALAGNRSHEIKYLEEDAAFVQQAQRSLQAEQAEVFNQAWPSVATLGDVSAIGLGSNKKLVGQATKLSLAVALYLREKPSAYWHASPPWDALVQQAASVKP